MSDYQIYRGEYTEFDGKVMKERDVMYFESNYAYCSGGYRLRHVGL
jgi:hypothetical protein